MTDILLLLFLICYVLCNELRHNLPKSNLYNERKNQIKQNINRQTLYKENMYLKAACDVTLDPFVLPTEKKPFYYKQNKNSDQMYFLDATNVYEARINNDYFSILKYEITLNTVNSTDNSALMDITLISESTKDEYGTRTNLHKNAFIWSTLSTKLYTLGLSNNVYSNICNFTGYNEEMVNKFKLIFNNLPVDHIDSYIPVSARSPITLGFINGKRYTEDRGINGFTTTIIKNNIMCSVDKGNTPYYIASIYYDVNVYEKINKIYTIEPKTFKMLWGTEGELIDECEYTPAEPRCLPPYVNGTNIALSNDGKFELYIQFSRVGYEHTNFPFTAAQKSMLEGYEFCYEDIDDSPYTTTGTDTSDSDMTTGDDFNTTTYDNNIIYTLSIIIVFIIILL